MASAATLSPADTEKLSKLKAAVSGLSQIRYGNVDINPCVFMAFLFVVISICGICLSNGLWLMSSVSDAFVL